MDGADAVGGALSVTTVDVVVFVSAANNVEGKSATRAIMKKSLIEIIGSPYNILLIFIQVN